MSTAFALCLMLCATPALGADLPADLASALRDYDRAQFTNDVATLDRLVVDDFVLVNSNASVEGKAQFLADFKLTGFKIEPYVIEQPVHKVWRDGAVIGGLVNLRWTQDGQHQTRSLRVAYVWMKRDGRWLATYAQVTRIPTSGELLRLPIDPNPSNLRALLVSPLHARAHGDTQTPQLHPPR